MIHERTGNLEKAILEVKNAHDKINEAVKISI